MKGHLSSSNARWHGGFEAVRAVTKYFSPHQRIIRITNSRDKSFWATSYFPLCSFLKKIFIYWLLERDRKGRERERSIGCSTYLHIHWLILVCVLTKDPTGNRGESYPDNALTYWATWLGLPLCSQLPPFYATLPLHSSIVITHCCKQFKWLTKNKMRSV